MQIKKIFFTIMVGVFLMFISGCSDSGVKSSGLSGGLAIDSSQKEITTKETNLNNNNNNNMSSHISAPAINQELIQKYPFALIKTNFGDIKVKLSGVNAPLAVTNFLQLAQNKFYDGVRFHRVIKGFMIQTGDPFSKDDAIKNRWGTGDPGYKFNDELNGSEKYTQGTLAMANSGPNTNGSQFFIVTADPQVSLPASYTVFGQVVLGMDTALKIENVPTTTPDRPISDVVVTSIMPLEK